MITFIFVIFLIFAPMYMFMLCRRVFHLSLCSLSHEGGNCPHLYTTQEIEGEENKTFS